MFHHSQVLGPDTAEIRKGYYDYCGIQELRKVEYQTVEVICQQTWQFKKLLLNVSPKLTWS
jgi:hypothetical protein